MVKIWNYFSYLGLDDKTFTTSNRNTIVANRLNFVMAALMVLLIITTTIVRHIIHGVYTIHTKKLLILFLVCLISFVFSACKFHRVTKISLIFFPSAIIVLLPIFLGSVQVEDIIYSPLVIIAASLIPQLILEPKLSNKLYITSLLSLFIPLLFFYELMQHFSSVDLGFIAHMNNIQIYYKIVVTAVFLYIHITLYYLRNLNYNYELELNANNKELKSTVDELRKTQQHLIQSEKMASLGTLTAGVAHEINNPLNFINGGYNILSDIEEVVKKHSPQEVHERYNTGTNMINNGLQRASEIVKSLMTFSHPDSFGLVPYQINKIIETTLVFLKSNIPYDIEIIKDYEFKGEVLVYPGKFHQLIINIIDNAIYALNRDQVENKKINITVRQIINSVLITIHNNGPKIPEKILNHIFDPFFTTKEPGQGTGLGLAICYTIVTEHRGTIYAKNTDNGVAFIIEIPLKKNS